MSMIKMMRAKLHRVKVTECSIDYVGSISLDEDWMKAIGMLPLEEVHVCNVTNGARFQTYAIPAKSGSKTVGPNGACAILCDIGDILIVFSYLDVPMEGMRNGTHKAKVLTFNANGDVETSMEQLVTCKPNGEFTFESELKDL